MEGGQASPEVPAVERVLRMLDAFPSDKLRFLTAPDRRRYVAVLGTLFRLRRRHLLEIAHEDLWSEAQSALVEAGDAAYDLMAFRADADQLERWGNMASRLEPQRIESLADRRRQKFLYRLDDDTRALLSFLEGRLQAAAVAEGQLDQNLLHDIMDALSQARRLAKSGEPTPRLVHLLSQVDDRVGRVTAELIDFTARLSLFASQPFDVDVLAELLSWLDRYVQRYLSQALALGEKIERRVKGLSRAEFAAALAAADAAARAEWHENPLTRLHLPPFRAPREVLATARPFFAPAGHLARLTRSVNEQTRALAQKIHHHLESLRLRNVRIGTVRTRIEEVLALPPLPGGPGAHDPDLAAFLGRLYVSAHMVADARTGTPAEKSMAPRPRRRYESRRAPFTAGYLEPKVGAPGEARALSRAAALSANAFVERALLRGRPEAPLQDARLEGFPDLRALLSALKLHALRGGRDRRHLSYRVAAPAPREARALLEGERYLLEAPDLRVRRRASP